EQALLVGDLDGDRAPSVRNDYRARRWGIGHLGEVARAAGPAADEVPVPAAVPVAVDVVLAVVVVAVLRDHLGRPGIDRIRRVEVVRVLVRLHERPRSRTVVTGRGRAVGGVAREGAVRRRGE